MRRSFDCGPVTRKPWSLGSATGFDVLACRVVRGRLRPDDLSAGADALLQGLAAGERSGYVDPGYAMDSAWRGVLPPGPASSTWTTCRLGDARPCRAG